MLIRYFLLAVFCITGSKLFAQEREPNASLVFDLNVDSAYVQFGLNNPYIVKVASNDTIPVTNGFYHLTLSYPTSEDYYTNQNVLKGSINTITHDFDLSDNNINLRKPNIAINFIMNDGVLVTSDHNTEIYLNDKLIGKEFTIFRLTNPTNKLSFKNSDFHTHSRSVSESKKFQLIEHYFKSKKQPSLLLTVVPGYYQLKDKSYIKGGVIVTGIITSFVLSVKYQNEYKIKKNEFDVTRNLYLTVTDEWRAQRLGVIMQKEAKALSDEDTRRKIAFWSLIGFTTYDYIDKIITYKRLPKKSGIDLTIELEPYFKKYVQLGAKIKL